MGRLRWNAVLIATLLSMVLPAVAHAQTLTATWDPNPPSDQITSYQVCIGTTSLSCNFQLATVPATENSYEFTPNAGVLYYIAVRAVNSAGAGSYSPQVTVSIPSLSQPANQTSTVNVAISPLVLTATDPDGSSLQFSHTGLPFGLILNQTTGIITGVPTSAGPFSVSVFVTDGLATTSRTFSWTVQNGGPSDTNAPSVSITSHTNGQTVTTSSITLAGTASDSGSGGSGVTSVTVNGSAATGGTASGSNTANWSRNVNLSSGANQLTVVATDGAGNTRTTQITVNRTAADTTAPTLSITSHSNNQNVTTSSITLAGSASDNGSGGNGINSVTVNGSAATGGTASGNNSANWTRNVNLSMGANTLSVVATDGAGNARTVSITINRGTADTTAPTIAVTSHSSNQVVNTATITLSGTATDSGAGGSGVTGVTVNGSAATGGTASGNGTANWSRSVTLSAGANTITVVATDGAGNARTTPITVRLDSTAPALAITSHTAGQNVTTPSIMLAGTATDSGRGDSGIASVLVNGLSATGGTASGANTSNWSRSVTLAIGANTIAVETRDTAGNITASQITINYAIAPVTSVSLASNPASPQLLNAETAVAFTAAGVGGVGPRQYKFLVQQGSGAAQVAQNWSTAASFLWTPTAVGTYTVTVWARSAGVTADVANASAQMSYTIYTPAPLALTGLTSNVAAPQAPGTAVTFTAQISGGSAPYSTKWWVFDGVTWTMARNWAAGTTYTWTPTAGNANYRVGVWVRDATTTADVNSMTASIPYVITGASAPPATPPPPTPPPATPPAAPLSVSGVTSNVAAPAGARHGRDLHGANQRRQRALLDQVVGVRRHDVDAGAQLGGRDDVHVDADGGERELSGRRVGPRCDHDGGRELVHGVVSLCDHGCERAAGNATATNTAAGNAAGRPALAPGRDE
jgi:hypothetical protein